MAKPMLVTLPVLLLLLDIWPLGRARGRTSLGPLVREKWALFGLSAASGLITVLAQRSGGAVMNLQVFPLSERLANAPLAVGAYLVDFVWPGPRSIFYPHPGATVSWAAAATVTVLLALATFVLLRSRSRFPYSFVGWTWFLVALLPVLGIVQVGLQARADRYTYLPYLGLFVAVVFAFRAAASRWRVGPASLGLAAIVLVAAAAATTRAESAFWKGDLTLFERARAVTGPNAVAEHALGAAHLEAGQLEPAERHFRSALELLPVLTGARLGLGRVLLMSGQIDEAARAYEEILAQVPGYVEAANNLAYCRLRQGELGEARELFSQAVTVNPRLVASIHVLGMLEAALGRRDEAVARLAEAVRLSPGKDSWALDLDGARALARGEDSPASRRFRVRLGAYHREAAVALEARGRAEAALSHMIEAERIESGAHRAPLAGAPGHADTTNAGGVGQ
jgi:tetratricopeptide (TPR) repeat protein